MSSSKPRIDVESLSLSKPMAEHRKAESAGGKPGHQDLCGIERVQGYEQDSKEKDSLDSAAKPSTTVSNPVDPTTKEDMPLSRTIMPSKSSDSHLLPHGQSPQESNASPAAQAKVVRLRSQIANLETQIISIKAKVESTLEEFSHVRDRADTKTSEDLSDEPQEHDLTDDQQACLLASAEATVKQHIKLLHQYNQIRDIGMGLCGVIADSR